MQQYKCFIISSLVFATVIKSLGQILFDFANYNIIIKLYYSSNLLILTE